ncbi:MAG: MopE-related protein [Archangium sp.]
MNFRRFLLLVLSTFVLAACNCGKKPAAPALLKEGEPCDNDERCETGLCDSIPGITPTCVRRCGDGCFTTEVCVQLTPNRFACQPDARKLCAPCVADTDCPYPSDHCISVNSEHVCGRDCAFDQNCPTGYRCVNAVGVDGLPKVQQCVPINASCACLARGDFMQVCSETNAFGSCLGIKQCDLVNNMVACDARTPGQETCNGIDDNCNGQTDEGQMPTSCGVGACERMVDSCADGGVVNCVPGAPISELCNSIDDDCDGTVDNGFDLTMDGMNCGRCGNVCGAAHATASCVNSGCQITCDTGYANCNMMDGDGCETNITNDINNCGGCNQTCMRPNSTATCMNSSCSFVCAPGWVDLNMNPNDGCECNPANTMDLPDLMFLDANCDGIDGEVNNGIFVSPMGNDSNNGTMMNPVQTLQTALGLAVTMGKRDIYVAEGSYNGQLDLSGVSGINIAGGYNATTWQRALTQTTTVTNGNPGLKIDGSNQVLVQVMRFVGVDGNAGSPSAYGAKITESSAIRLESVDIRAGNGLTGGAGSSPGQAANGNVGNDGRRGCYNDPRWDPFNNTTEFAACNTTLIYDFCSSAPVGGLGGSSACGASGGAGGSATRYNPSGTPNGSPGVQGSPSGGTGGQGVPAGTTPSPGSAYFGGDGMGGTNGGNGNGAMAGTFNTNGYVLPTATAGTGGTAGRGGGGGGGGAGGIGYVIPGYNGLQCYTYGSTGAGGGSAGCGGNGGGAGISGGASIGLFIYNSQVTAQATLIRAGNGGNGGAGGNGGGGGMGAGGGNSDYNSKQGMATRGGGGGRGGNGGSGGHGGGGSGGPSYGVARNSGGSSWMPTGGSIMIGTPGTAGTSSGSAGMAGASGTVTSF